MTPCSHIDFAAHVDVDRIVDGQPVNPQDEHGRAAPSSADEITAFRATIRLECAACGAAFGFRTAGVVGDLPDRPAVSPDALELRVPVISPAELELSGPLAALSAPDGVPGYSVKVR